MTIPRKEARKAVAALLATIPEFVAVYDYEIDDFDEATPVAMVHSDGTITTDPPVTFGCPAHVHALLVHIFVKRNPPTSEDDIDDLSGAVFTMLEANPTNAAWDNMQIDAEFSDTDHVMMIKSIQYRHEVLRVLIW